MKEHPIIFTGESVRSILDGRKTQTRRLIPQWAVARAASNAGGLDPVPGQCWFPGDKLWVRETWADLTADHPSAVGGVKPKDGDRIVYQADPADCYQWWRIKTGDFYTRSPIHMPRWASRITLEVLSVRVQRLQAISEEDAKAEGVDGHVGGEGPVSREALLTEPGLWHPRFYRDGFEWAWSNLHDKPSEFGASWASNPWVWAIEFKRLAEHTTHKET